MQRPCDVETKKYHYDIVVSHELPLTYYTDNGLFPSYGVQWTKSNNHHQTHATMSMSKSLWCACHTDTGGEIVTFAHCGN
jgi:hypothetical protein